MEERIQEFDVSSATVELAAAALDCEPQRIAKSLSFLVDGHAVLVVAAGDARVDNHKYKEQFKTKAKMLSAMPWAEYARLRSTKGWMCIWMYL